MTRLGRPTILVLTILLGGSNGLASAQQRPVFRTSTTAVSVDVSVRAGNLPVDGLTAADFSVTDRGVSQKIDLLEVSAIPVDVTIAIDVSDTAAQKFGQFRADLAAIAALLRPDDRLRVIGFGYDIVETHALQQVAIPSVLERTVTLGGVSLHDAVASALVSRHETGRRRLVVVLADLTDSLSVLSADRVLAITRRSDAVLHLVGLRDRCAPRSGPTWRRDEPMPPGFLPQRGSRRYPAAVPCDPDAIETLTAAADATGGNIHDISWISGSALGGFKKAYNEFRSSYVLRYQPTGVAREGWHEIDVKVLRPGKYNVRARKGYFGGRP